jgi:hypothetical protein
VILVQNQFTATLYQIKKEQSKSVQLCTVTTSTKQRACQPVAFAK